MTPPYTLLIKRQTPHGFARLLDRYTDPLTALHWARVNYEGNPDGIISFELRYLGLLVADTRALVGLFAGYPDNEGLSGFVENVITPLLRQAVGSVITVGEIRDYLKQTGRDFVVEKEEML